MGKRIIFRDLILFEDNHFVIINKPPFLSSLDERLGSAENVLTLARGYLSELTPCHRLDKETSGVMALAKTSEAYKHLAQRFEKREILKKYHALVPGIRELKDFEVDLAILQLTGGNVRADPYRGKPAFTIFNALETIGNFTLVDCEPVTGRMHQIRIHLAASGMPIAGDLRYGGEPVFLSQIKKKFNLKKETEEEPITKRTMLHAASMTFEMPSGEVKIFKAPYPKDFRAVLEQLRKYA